MSECPLLTVVHRVHQQLWQGSETAGGVVQEEQGIWGAGQGVWGV